MVLTMLDKLRYALVALPVPLLMGAQGDGCAANSTSPAPDVRGTWGITYDDTIGLFAARTWWSLRAYGF